MRAPSENAARKPSATWTADRLAQLEQLSKAGATAQAIADQLGISRSAVMGKLFRLRRAAEKQRASRQRSKNRIRKRGKSLLELSNESCRWPIGDPASDQFHFCGAPGADLEQDVPYCADHMRRAYVASPPRKAGGPGFAGGWHAVSPGIIGEPTGPREVARPDDRLRDAVLRTAMATVRRMFRDAIARKART